MSEPSDVPPRLTVITLGARDLATLREFYKGFGWRPGNEIGDEFASFLLGGVVLALYPLDLLAEEAAPGRAPPAGGWSGVTLACNVADRADVDRVYRAALAADAAAVSEPVDRDWGGRSAYIADPEGNRWEIVWAPGLEFDDRGAVSKFGGD